MGSPERVVKCSLRSAGGLDFVSDILRQYFQPIANRQIESGHGMPCPY